MIKPQQRFPGLNRVTCFTGDVLRRRKLVRIRMAGGATGVIELVASRTRCVARLVAVHTRNSQMSSTKNEPRIAMAGEGKSGRSKSVDVVTGFALVLKALLELVQVDVLVTIEACACLRMVVRTLALAGMAFHTRHGRMLPHQWVLRCGMVGSLEGRRLEAIYGVTRTAVAFVQTSRELVLVFIGVTVRTLTTLDGRAKIGRLVTGAAGKPGVLSRERVPGLRVIEGTIER